MGAAPDAAERPYRGPWRRFIVHLVELSRRRESGLLNARALTWLEAEGLVVLDEERARLARQELPRD